MGQHPWYALEQLCQHLGSTRGMKPSACATKPRLSENVICRAADQAFGLSTGRWNPVQLSRMSAAHDSSSHASHTRVKHDRKTRLLRLSAACTTERGPSHEGASSDSCYTFVGSSRPCCAKYFCIAASTGEKAAVQAPMSSMTSRPGDDSSFPRNVSLEGATCMAMRPSSLLAAQDNSFLAAQDKA